MYCSSGHKKENEMVSLGDTAISLHTLQLQSFCSIYGGGVVKTQSAKFWPSLHWGVFLCSENSKCQVLAKFSFWGVFLGSQNSKWQVLAKFSWGGGGVFLGSQNSKCQVLATFSFSEGEGYSLVVKTQSAKFFGSFIFKGGILG